jgi:carboxymethylenebutenolidase
MCDDDIHPGLMHDDRVSRRTFGLTAAASVVFAAAVARAENAVTERDVDIKTADGTADAALFYPAAKGTWPAVLIWPDILGLRPVFRQIGRRLAADGYVVLVPNPFYRQQHAPVVDGSFDFSKPEDRAKVVPLAAALTPEGTTSDGKTFLAFLDQQPQTNTKAKAGVQGYCMGGPLTFRTAAALPDRIGAAATFHGASLVTDKPDSPHLLIPSIKAGMYCAVADNDDKRDPKAKDVLKDGFAKAHVAGRVEVYAGANHGWCVPGNGVYNEAAAERAWRELTTLYKAKLT